MKNHFFIILFYLTFGFSQWFFTNHQGNTRSYYVSYPGNSNSPSGLIINLHGYGSNAISQRSYSNMDPIAHNQNLAVVYPQGLNNSWNVYTFWDNNSYDDVSFISNIIDEISQNFNIDLDRVYACGMSNGGYMSYRLACDLSDKIAAFGSVTGNFMINNSLFDCQNQNRDISIIHIHGTADEIVDYYPPSFDGSLTAEQAIQFWRNHSELTLELSYSLNEYVDISTFYNESNIAEYIHYKVIGGGHDWFGSPWSYNWGFNTSQVLVDFFGNHHLSDYLNILLGDLNDDGLINILDVIQLIDIVIEGLFESHYDLNQDQFINVLDIILLVNIILGY